MPQKGLDPLPGNLPAEVRDVVEDLREIYTEGPYERLREFEDALLAARTDHPGLVTVSSATCSRMLGPRRTREGRTALPRWPSVQAFLIVHGVDPEPFAPRWAAARQAWSAVPAEAVAGAGLPSWRPRVGLSVLAGVALFLAGTVAGLLLAELLS